jgi:hypothetical protein
MLLPLRDENEDAIGGCKDRAGTAPGASTLTLVALFIAVINRRPVGAAAS